MNDSFQLQLLTLLNMEYLDSLQKPEKTQHLKVSSTKRFLSDNFFVSLLKAT